MKLAFLAATMALQACQHIFEPAMKSAGSCSFTLGNKSKAMTAVVTLIVGAISAGVSYYNQKSAAASQSRIASANFMLQSQAAEMERQSAQFQFEQNQKQFDLEKKQQLQQAEMLRSQADSEETASRANVAATRKDYERMKAIQRARLAKSGVVEAGTPLDIPR
jgi:hypothetical protein